MVKPVLGRIVDAYSRLPRLDADRVGLRLVLRRRLNEGASGEAGRREPFGKRVEERQQAILRIALVRAMGGEPV